MTSGISGARLGPYNEILLVHGRRPLGRSVLSGPDVLEIVRENPDCADSVRVTLALRPTGVSIGVVGDGCVVFQASGSLLVDAIQAAPVLPALERIALVLSALDGTCDGPSAADTRALGTARALIDVRVAANRLGCARLPWLMAREGIGDLLRRDQEADR